VCCHLDPEVNFDFDASTQDVMSINETLSEFIENEAVCCLKKALEKTRFLTHPTAQLRSLLSREAVKKGLLTRLREGDPALLRMKTDNSRRPEQVEKEIFYVAQKCLNDSVLRAGDSDLLFNLEEVLKFLKDSYLQDRKFVLTESTLGLQHLAKKVETRLENWSSSTRVEQRIAGLQIVSFMSPSGLEPTLKVCLALLNLYEQCPNRGKRLDLSSQAEFLWSWAHF